MVIAHHDYGPKSVLTSEICGEKDYQHETTERKGKKDVTHSCSGRRRWLLWHNLSLYTHIRLSSSVSRDFKNTFVKCRNTGIVQIQNGTASFHKMTRHLRWGRQPIPQKLLIFWNQPLQLSVLRCDGIEFVDIELAELFNIYRSAVIVGFMVELRVVLDHLTLFGVVEAIAA